MRGRPTGRSKTTVVAMIVAGALTIAGCGDEESGQSAKPETLAIEVVRQGKDTFRLRAPRSVQAGLVEISLTSPPGEGTHDAQLVRVEGDHTAKEVVTALLAAGEGAPIPRWLTPAGGVGLTQAGTSGRVVQQLVPGTYYILDTRQPEGDDVKSYFETGAVTALDVTGEAGAEKLPETDVSITAKEYTFTVRGLKAGTNRIEFENAGKEPHHLIAFPYRKGATLADVKKDFIRFLQPPVGGIATLEPATKQVTELELKPGKYALVCFANDRNGGPPHIAKGMVVEAAVE